MTPAVADEAFPNRPITIVVPFTAGGGVDTFGRFIGEKLQARLGQPVIIENKPGAGGNIGANQVAKAKPDGYTLMVATNGVSINHWLHKDLPFDISTDLAPVGIFANQPVIVAVSPDVPANSMKELIDYAKANPAKVRYGTPGVGSPQHLATEMFINLSGAKMDHVPYRGATQLIPDVAAGRVPIMFGVLASTAPYIESKQLRALATGGAKRTEGAYAHLPTVGETVPGYEFGVWFGIMAPAGTPEPVLEKLSGALNAIAAQADFREQMTRSGYEVLSGSRAGMGETIRTDLGRFGTIMREIGIAAR